MIDLDGVRFYMNMHFLHIDVGSVSGEWSLLKLENKTENTNLVSTDEQCYL